jgi:hypothetical protein
MVQAKSLDESKLIAALLRDVHTLHSGVFSPRALRLTTLKVKRRVAREGVSFLTKTLPRLGKALDRALSGEVQLDATGLAFKSLPGSKLPSFLGELFQLVFNHDGWVLPTPCVASIRTLRQVLYLFYKYELPYSLDDEQEVIDQFVKADRELLPYNQLASLVYGGEHGQTVNTIPVPIGSDRVRQLLRRASGLLSEVFRTFDIMDIHPRHGPGAVSTGEQLWDKYRWTNVSSRITSTYPFDAYFQASLGHVCDSYPQYSTVGSVENPAKVILVPKDSRGPRLISCEPLDFQWIQQGLGRAIVRHLELHPLTRYNIHFTDQQPNQIGALLGSSTGWYSTLDLKEASDRVSIGLVRLLFPEPLLTALMNCRSLSTQLPDGNIMRLNKFAPMGSALCFPVLATTVWALLAAGCWDAYPNYGRVSSHRAIDAKSCRVLRKYTLDRILVYGDDVIVPAGYTANAIELLEAFGLKVNRAKSCTSGFFRESCGMDAYKGEPVTPVRFRTVWRNSPSPDSYVSWISYANSCFRRGYHNVYDTIVEALLEVYGEIPDEDMNLSCPALIEVPEAYRPKTKRVNADLQKLQYRVWDIRSRVVKKEIDGWSMLLRYFAEADPTATPFDTNDKPRRSGVQLDSPVLRPRRAYSVRSYTKRSSVKLIRAWR